MSEIHDRIGHTLTSISLKIALLRGAIDSDEKDVVVKDVREAIEQSVNEVQSMIFESARPSCMIWG